VPIRQISAVKSLKSSQTFTAVESESSPAPVTAQTSRRNFERNVAVAVAQCDAQVLAVLDVDHFRLFKTLHGMSAADALLRILSRRLDVAATALGGSFACLGGDEFVIAVPVKRLAGDPAAWSRALLDEASAPFAYRGESLSFSATLGYALLPDHGNNVDEALHCARLAVGPSKAAGGGLARRCSAIQVQQARGREERARELGAAIQSGQIVPYYQPVISLANGRIAGMEVLARWLHPRHGLLQPSAFIPLAQERGLCRDISRALLRQVQHDQRGWPRSWHFAFNTTPGDVAGVLAFIEGPDISSHDMIDPARIELEVTETAVMRDLAESHDLLAAFGPHGIKLVLDDFGTGYANFQQLRQIPFARLKIDKSFIVDMMADQRAASCVAAIIQLAHHLGMTATAEGVEQEAVADRLAEMGCDHAQGYHYARPMPAAEVAWLIDAAPFAKSGLDHAA
jgi:predicted signal transduction protein with EAL and GGDEF domain